MSNEYYTDPFESQVKFNRLTLIGLSFTALAIAGIIGYMVAMAANLLSFIIPIVLHMQLPLSY